MWFRTKTSEGSWGLTKMQILGCSRLEGWFVLQTAVRLPTHLCTFSDVLSCCCGEGKYVCPITGIGFVVLGV